MKLVTKEPSNKAETPALETDEPPADPQLSAKHNLPFIDKISIMVSPPDEEEAHEIYNQIILQMDDPELFASGAKKKGKFNFAKRIPLASTDNRPLFQSHLDKSAKAAMSIRLEFNPRKLGLEGVEELHSKLTCLMDGGWGYVLQHGKITRLDVAVDLPGIRPGAFSVLPKQGATQRVFEVNGQLETLILGKKNGHQTIVYNKKKQRLAKKQQWDGPSTTRVERRLCPPQVATFTDLSQLPNPFLALMLVEMPGPPEGEKPWIWELFKDAVAVRHLQPALALLPEARRTKYRAHLKQHAHAMWDADAIWKNWPAALVSLKLHAFC